MNRACELNEVNNTSYHRKPQRLIAIDLKLGKFKASDKGQMELYLAWRTKHEMVKGEKTPLGLILCATKNEEHVELMQLEKSNIKIAEYLTKLPDIKLLEIKVAECALHYFIRSFFLRNL